jgi:exportin-1
MTTKDTDAIALYKTMRETLVYLTHIDYSDTEKIMLAKLSEQCSPDTNGFTWNGTNTLSWAIGSISGAMSEEDEKRFLVIVLKDLLGLCERVRGKDNKAVVASDIMYVVGQYPRFLQMHWRFLKTVVSKLFEFMHELHPGVRDMACDTFLKLTHKCRRKFVQIHPLENTPFVDTLLSSLPTIMSDLEPHQVHTLYEACAVIITAQTDPTIRASLLGRLMEVPNHQWGEIMVCVLFLSLFYFFLLIIIS